MITEQQAIALAELKFWEPMSLRERATFQLFEPLLCMPFGVFHEAVERTLGRDVSVLEFGLNLEGLKAELIGEKPAPTLDEIINMIPEGKRIIVVVA